MILLNGRGQLGEELKKLISREFPIEIYHTWNYKDKSFSKQKEEYEKYINFLEDDIYHRPSNKVVFISSTNHGPNPYTYFKREACKITEKEISYLIIRLPNLIGPGVLDKMIHSDTYTEGVINYTTVKKAAAFVYNSAMSHENTTITCPSEPISVSNLKSIIQYVKNET
jgi:hypothetical protein